MPDRFDVDAAVVTGAGRGIGREVALALGRAGVSVLCVSRTDSCERTAAEVESAGGHARALPVDLAHHGDAGRMVAEFVASQPRVRWAGVLAAGITGPAGPLDTQDLTAWEEVFRVNVLGNLAVARALLPAMVRARFGRLVFFSGGGAAYGYPLFPAYSCTKTALVRAVENLNLDLVGTGDLSVVCLAPGAVATDLLASVRAAGGEVRTEAKIEETISFLEGFLSGEAGTLSGRLVHVRDDWGAWLGPATAEPSDSHWKLRRVQ